jgi:hypothetical protein
MVVKAKQENVGAITVSTDTLAKLMQQLETQGQQIASLIDSKASAKPAAAQAAKVTPPDFQMGWCRENMALQFK